jgi:hypothetical protein
MKLYNVLLVLRRPDAKGGGGAGHNSVQSSRLPVPEALVRHAQHPCVPSPGTKCAWELNPYTPHVCYCERLCS